MVELTTYHTVFNALNYNQKIIIQLQHYNSDAVRIM